MRSGADFAPSKADGQRHVRAAPLLHVVVQIEPSQVFPQHGVASMQGPLSSGMQPTHAPLTHQQPGLLRPGTHPTQGVRSGPQETATAVATLIDPITGTSSPAAASRFTNTRRSTA